MLLASPAVAGINDGLLAHYPFDGNADDTSGNGNHGTAYNDFSYVPGVADQAIHLVGSGHTGLGGGHVLIPSLPLDTLDEFTIGLWAYYEGHTTTFGGESFIQFGRGAFGDNSIYGITYNPDDTGIGYHAGGPWTTGVSSVGTPWSADFQDNWHHFALRVENGTLTGFLDGLIVGTDTYSKPTTSTLEEVAGIGVHWFNSGGTESNRFIGSIDDVRIYDRALSDAEVLSLVPEPSGMCLAVIGCLICMGVCTRRCN
nr:LamG domain-containing protein [Aeoliella straminimaris]